MHKAIVVFVVVAAVGMQLVLPATALEPIWKVREKNSDFRIVTDSAGNSYLISAEDGLVKRDARGRRHWMAMLPESVSVLGLALDRQGNVLLTGGRYQGGAQEVVTMSFDAEGQFRWRTDYSGAGHMSECAGGIGVDDQGGIYVVGRAFVTTNGIAENYHLFLSYSADGTLLWERLVRSFTGTAINTTGMAINPNGGVAGITQHSLAVCSRDGELLWSWQADDSFFTSFDNVLYRVGGYDASNHLYVVGVSAQNGGRYPAVQKFSPEGEVMWMAPYESPSERSGSAWDIRVDAAGNAYVGLDDSVACHAEHSDDGIDVECDDRPAIIKFHPHGNIAWVTRFANTRGVDTELAGIDLRADGSCVLSARTYREQEIFLGLCDPQGSQWWSGYFSYKAKQRAVWALPAAFDARGGIRAPAELIDRTAGSIDILLTRFKPIRFPGTPVIQTLPLALGVRVGETLTLKVVASGTSPLRYQWRFKSKNLIGSNSSTLRLVNVQPSQAGDYSVEVQNYRGRITSTESRVEVYP